jgi:hypothetical protein
VSAAAGVWLHAQGDAECQREANVQPVVAGRVAGTTTLCGSRCSRQFCGSWQVLSPSRFWIDPHVTQAFFAPRELRPLDRE